VITSHFTAYIRGESDIYPLDGKLSGPYRYYGPSGEEKNSQPLCREQNTAAQTVVRA